MDCHVFVISEYRSKGVGRALVSRIGDEARKLGVSKLFLFTPDRETFYSQLGWHVFERTNYRNEDVVIMTKEITDLEKY
jgi:N-acetylglutamate synthase-like GNAT family acetyltransferase